MSFPLINRVPNNSSKNEENKSFRAQLHNNSNNINEILGQYYNPEHFTVQQRNNQFNEVNPIRSSYSLKSKFCRSTVHRRLNSSRDERKKMNQLLIQKQNEQNSVLNNDRSFDDGSTNITTDPILKGLENLQNQQQFTAFQSQILLEFNKLKSQIDLEKQMNRELKQNMLDTLAIKENQQKIDQIEKHIYQDSKEKKQLYQKLQESESAKQELLQQLSQQIKQNQTSQQNDESNIFVKQKALFDEVVRMGQQQDKFQSLLLLQEKKMAELDQSPRNQMIIQQMQKKLEDIVYQSQNDQSKIEDLYQKWGQQNNQRTDEELYKRIQELNARLDFIQNRNENSENSPKQTNQNKYELYDDMNSLRQTMEQEKMQRSKNEAYFRDEFIVFQNQFAKDIEYFRGIQSRIEDKLNEMIKTEIETRLSCDLDLKNLINTISTQIINEVNNHKEHQEQVNYRINSEFKLQSDTCSERSNALSRFIENEIYMVKDENNKKHGKLKVIITKLAEQFKNHLLQQEQKQNGSTNLEELKQLREKFLQDLMTMENKLTNQIKNQAVSIDKNTKMDDQNYSQFGAKLSELIQTQEQLNQQTSLHEQQLQSIVQKIIQNDEKFAQINIKQTNLKETSDDLQTQVAAMMAAQAISQEFHSKQSDLTNKINEIQSIFSKNIENLQQEQIQQNDQINQLEDNNEKQKKEMEEQIIKLDNQKIQQENQKIQLENQKIQLTEQQLKLDEIQLYKENQVNEIIQTDHIISEQGGGIDDQQLNEMLNEQMHETEQLVEKKIKILQQKINQIYEEINEEMLKLETRQNNQRLCDLIEQQENEKQVLNEQKNLLDNELKRVEEFLQSYVRKNQAMLKKQQSDLIHQKIKQLFEIQNIFRSDQISAFEKKFRQDFDQLQDYVNTLSDKLEKLQPNNRDEQVVLKLFENMQQQFDHLRDELDEQLIQKTHDLEDILYAKIDQRVKEIKY